MPPGELPTIKALTYSSTKWPWVADQARRAWGSGVEVVRASVGRLGERRVSSSVDRTLIDRTFAEARTIPGWEQAALVNGPVSRWGGALPQYRVGHRDLVAQLHAVIAGQPGWPWPARHWTASVSRLASVRHGLRSTRSSH